MQPRSTRRRRVCRLLGELRRSFAACWRLGGQKSGVSSPLVAKAIIGGRVVNADQQVGRVGKLHPMTKAGDRGQGTKLALRASVLNSHAVVTNRCGSLTVGGERNALGLDRMAAKHSNRLQLGHIPKRNVVGFSHG
jgi:hypothetical protein